MQFFNLHTHNYTKTSSVLELVNQYPLEFDATVPFYSIGIHPWKIVVDAIEAELQIIESKLPLENCLALGECGLDKRIDTPLDLQVQVFEKQLLLAQKHKKPVIIHCVAAFQEVMEIKKRLNISVPMIVHGFSKNSQVANQLVAAGFYLSFGKYLLRNPELEAVFLSVPNDHFFLETDTVEETIEEVYTLAAKYKNIEVEVLLRLINKNFETVFNVQ